MSASAVYSISMGGICVCACVLVYENVDKETMYRAAHCLPCFPL